MAYYSKKPVIIEAVQYNNNPGVIYDFCGDCVREPVGEDYMVIHTLEGDMKISRNDYVIKGVTGEFYPCKPNIFEMTYECVDLLQLARDGKEGQA